jgi:hypothetical protein
MTLLQQENRAHCSAKVAVAHQRKDDLAQASVDDAPVESVEPCLLWRGNRARGFALAGDLQAGVWLLRHRHGGPLLLFSVRVLGRQIIHKA